MRSIRIIKQKQGGPLKEVAPEDKKPDEHSARKITHTIKSWIAETEERRRNGPRSLSALGVVIFIAFAVAMAQSPASQTSNNGAIKVTIATTNGFLGPPVARYKLGQQIPVTITMTNTSNEPVYTCISSDVYQDVPKLTRDGELVPYMKWQSHEMLTAVRNHMCEQENLPESVLLQPNEAKLADWFVLVDDPLDGADTWYDSLPVGKYELSLERRLSCCGGPMVESNKIAFEVVP